jgi:hypothetical protein
MQTGVAIRDNAATRGRWRKRRFEPRSPEFDYLMII